jgi:homospermidine synthase
MFHKNGHHDWFKRIGVAAVTSCCRVFPGMVDEFIKRILIDISQRPFEIIPFPPE